MTDILVPTEQEGTKAVVKTWLKKVGDAVKVDDPIVELETDKVAVEVAATSAGVLSEILVADGAEVEPGTVLGRITSGGAVEETA
jgi:2-oxoglutarate dehydrogenase E2 component (dihydrolipoamide succinyltransferase)